MLTQDEITQALTQVIDPELGSNIVELGMVKDIHIEEGRVEMTLTLTVMACPMRNQLKQQTEEVVLSLPGVEQVTVHLAAMNGEERQQLNERLSPALRLNHIGRVIAVMSGKGGVGKSTVTALLAAALQRQGRSVGVLDADLTGPSIPRLFGVNGPVKGSPIGILPVETRTGIKVISTNLMLSQEDAAIIWRGPVMSNTVRQFWKDVCWGRLDYLLVDLPPGTSDVTLTAMQSYPLDGVVMVTMPQGLSSMVVRKTVHMAQGLNVPILGIVENMSYFVSPESGAHFEIFGVSHTDAVAECAGSPILARLPIDPALANMADEGQVEQYSHPAYEQLAAAFVEAAPPVEPAPAAPWLRR